MKTKTIKTPLMTAERDALSYRPVTIVPESKLSHMATNHYGFVPKLSHYEWKNLGFSSLKLTLLAWALMVGSANAQTSTSEVLLETTAGNIRIALFDETPQHRDNFLKLVKEHVYDSLLFHRVIKDFMIQSGDLHSKHAQPGQRLGSGDYNYTVEAEFRLPKIFHRRGMVAMAREGDRGNPERRSSACQFYIVWGRVYNDARLMKVQERLDTTAHIQLTPEMQEVYKTVGGVPHLDGQYTVFGEVVEGLDVVDRIQQSATDPNDRPLEDIRILRATVTKKP